MRANGLHPDRNTGGGAVIASLAGLLLPAQPGQERARLAACTSNLRQTGLGLTLYVDTPGQRFPARGRDNSDSAGDPATLRQVLQPTLRRRPVHLRDPARQSGPGTNYPTDYNYLCVHSNQLLFSDFDNVARHL
jgi:hypothetical protein